MKIFISEKDELNIYVKDGSQGNWKDTYLTFVAKDTFGQNPFKVESIEEHNSKLLARIFKQVYDYSNDLFQEGDQSTITMRELNFIIDKELQKEYKDDGN